MADKPILFSGPMVRAILEGRKTMTRRVLKHQPVTREGDDMVIKYEKGGHSFSGPRDFLLKQLADFGCKHRVGDRLWVRERFLPDAPATDDGWDDEGLSFVEWDGCGRRLDGIPQIFCKAEHCIYAADARWKDHQNWKWRPSIHMPRWASRITLEVIGVKVERLQDISQEDAKAEGAHLPRALTEDDGETYVDGFEEIWTTIYGPGSWEANPWVAAYSFKRL